MSAFKLRLEPRPSASALLMIGVPILSGLAALVLALAILSATGAPIGSAVQLLVTGAAGSVFALTETLTRATPLILTGLAVAVAFRARLWNIGAEGQLYAGALAAVAVGSGAIDAPSYILLPLVMLAGAAAGALLLLGPVLLKTRRSVDEVVTTLLLNFVVLLFVQMMLEGALKDPMGMGWPQSAPIVDEGTLPALIPQMRLHAGLILALVAAVVIHIMQRHTALGLEMRAVGGNAAAARFAGISVSGTLVITGLISGALAGLAGASEVAGLKGYLTSDLSPGFGYAGIVVAMLAQLNALAVVPSAIFIAAVFVGADSMSRSLGVSNYFADLVVALALMCTLAGSLFLRYRIRRAR
ncbi:MAG: ABC transporter permease [Rhodomicrobiaceae bacterium]